MIFGNGGSAAIASHFSVDLTKMLELDAQTTMNQICLHVFQMTLDMKMG